MASPLVRPMVSAGGQRKNRLDSVNDDENFNPRHRTRRYHFYSKCVDDKLASPIGAEEGACVFGNRSFRGRKWWRLFL